MKKLYVCLCVIMYRMTMFFPNFIFYSVQIQKWKTWRLCKQFRLVLVIFQLFSVTMVRICVCLCFIQGKAGYVAQGSNYARDRARAPLFSYVNEDKLKSIETYART